MEWDAEALTLLADHPTWPQVDASSSAPLFIAVPAPPFVAVKTTGYDGTGTDVNGLGQITQKTLHDEVGGAPLTRLIYTYNAVGQIHATITTHVATHMHHIIRFQYNTQGQVTRTVYDSGFILDITRDALGRATTLSDGSTRPHAGKVYL